MIQTILFFLYLFSSFYYDSHSMTHYLVLSKYLLRTARPDGPAGVMGRTLRYVLLSIDLK